MTDNKEVSLLFPQGQEVLVKGESIKIMPFGFGQYPRVLKALKGIALTDLPGSSASVGPVAVALTPPEGKKDEIAADVAANASKQVKSVSALDLFTENAEAVVDVCTIAANRPRSWFDDVPPDEGVALVEAIISVNVDFFVRRLQPRVLEAVKKFSESLGQL